MGHPSDNLIAVVQSVTCTIHLTGKQIIFFFWKALQLWSEIFILRAQMGSESIVHEAEGWKGYWLRGYEGERNNCFSKIQLVGQKNIETKLLSQVKAKLQSFLPLKHYKYGRRFSLLVGYNIIISLLVAQPIRTQHWW